MLDIKFKFLVQEVYEELLEAEDEWNKFLASADQTLITGQQSSPISEGGFISQEVQLFTPRYIKLLSYYLIYRKQCTVWRPGWASVCHNSEKFLYIIETLF